MKIINVIVILLIFINLINAQNNLTGIIKNEANSPLAGANIFIHELNKGTTTNQNGKFELLNLPNGNIKLQISFIGYGNIIKVFEFKGEPIHFDLVMHKTAIETEEIVVSGGFNSTQHENAVKIERLKLDPITLYNTPNFTEVITKVPGVDMISKGSGVSKPVIRGLSMNDVLVLNNNVRFENYQYSNHHPLGIDEFGIESIEIIKGPASLLYGSDAIGGVINFIKEKPAPTNTIEGDYNLQYHSNTLGNNHCLGIKGTAKKFYGGIRIGQKSNSDFIQGGGEFVPNTRFNEISFKTNLGYSNKIGTFNIYYDYNNQKLGLAEEDAVEGISVRGKKNKIFYQEFNTHLLSLQNMLYLGKFKVNIHSAFQNTELIHFGQENFYEIQMRLNTLTYETKLHLPTNKWSKYILGFQGLYQKNININERETILLPDAITENYGLYGLIQQTFITRLKLQSGIRYDYKNIYTNSVGNLSDTSIYRTPLEKSYGSLSGSFGLTYQLLENLTIRSNIAAGYRTPNLAELTSKGQHELRFELGDNNLKPENSYEFDFSIHLHKENLSFDVSIFHNFIQDYIFIAPTGNTISGLSVYQYKQLNSVLKGGETGLHLHPKFINWLHFETTFATVIGKQENGDYLPFIPAHKLNFEMRMEKKNIAFMETVYFSVNVISAFDQNKVAPNEETSKGYSLLNIGMQSMIKMKNQVINLGISANNLFDKKYIDHLSTLKEVNYFNPGRNISVNLKIPLVFQSL